jgi:hypothetical protein
MLPNSQLPLDIQDGIYQVSTFAERRIEVIERACSITSITTYQTNTKYKLTVGKK